MRKTQVSSLVSHFPVPPSHSVLTNWHGVVSLSLNIVPKGGGRVSIMALLS